MSVLLYIPLRCLSCRIQPYYVIKVWLRLESDFIASRALRWSSENLVLVVQTPAMPARYTLKRAGSLDSKHAAPQPMNVG